MENEKNEIEKPINKPPRRNYSTMSFQELKQSMKLTDEPIEIECPECKNKSLTITQSVCGKFTFIICVLFTLGCTCGLLPMVINDFKDTKHICSNCGASIGTHYLRLSS